MIGAVKEFLFARLLVTEDTQKTTQDILSTMYDGNMQVRKEGDLLLFHKVDPLLLWLINTIGCRRRLILACFADKFAFAKLPNGVSCYDNCHYGQVTTDTSRLCGKILLWGLHDVIAVHSIRYQETKEWIHTHESKAVEKEFQIQLLKEKEKLASQRETSTDVRQTVAEQKASLAIWAQACIEVCEQALNKYAIASWPRGKDGIMFPVEWRWKLAKYACNIRYTTDIAKKLRPECNLSMSALQGLTEAILEVIISSVAIIDNHTARQVLIRETSGTANHVKRQRRDTRLISSSEEKSKGDKVIDDAKITKI